MARWHEFAALAPTIAGVFARRHAATGRLCFLGTLRPDGFPRISPVEPTFVDGDLWVVGMPGTAKFADLARDPRFTLHTATTDPTVADGDAKVWGTVTDVTDPGVQQHFTEVLHADTGMDLRGRPLDHCFRVDVVGAAAVAVVGDHLDLTTWRVGHPERTVRRD